MSLDDSGNIQIDFVWGNMPLQPNDGRDLDGSVYLGVGDSHKINAVDWNGYPSSEPEAGATLESDPGVAAFRWPDVWLCGWDGQVVEDSKATNVINEMVSYGVPADYFVDFTFSGGETKWDANGGEPNWDGAIFYIYLNPYDTFGTDWLGNTIFGWQLEGHVIATNYYNGNISPVDTGNAYDYAIFVVSNDPRKDNGWWWW